MFKKVSYVQLLKEAISEYDAKAMDYKGPMTDPILTYDGGGELQTQKDASSILERYYFKEQEVNDFEPEYNEIVTGEEADSVDDTMDDFEDEILDELALEEEENEGHDDGGGEEVDSNPEEEPFDVDDLHEMDLFEEENEGHDDGGGEEEDSNPDENPLEDEKAQPMNNETVALENAIIEKLIMELEEEGGNDFEDPDNEQAGKDLEPNEETDEKIAGTNEDFDLFEDEDLEASIDGKEDKDEDEDDDLDVDKEVKSEAAMGPLKNPRDEVAEAFRIFREEIEKETEEEGEAPEEEKKEEEVTEEEDLDEAIDMLMFEEDDSEAEGGKEKEEEDEDEDDVDSEEAVS